LRSFVEYFRGDYPAANLVWGRITPAQLVSAGTLLAGVLLLFLLPKGKETRMENGG
jgi:hypothetical protein